MKNRITIKDIARELNVHHTTVSRALRNDSQISATTRKKIIDFAKSHGYQVNMSALHLRGSVRNVLAVLVPNINHQFFSNIVSIITDLAYQDGFIVSVFQSNENYKLEKEIINLLIRNNVAGVMASVSMETTSFEHFSMLKEYQIPLVFFDRVCRDINVPRVVVNNREIVEESVDLLVRKGYKNIAHLSGTEKLNVFRERQEGYTAAIQRHKLSYRKIYVIDHAFSAEDGERAIDFLFSAAEKPDAIICDSHNLMMGTVKKIRKMNLNIPDKVGIITFGENATAEIIEPGISSIVQPVEEMAHYTYKELQKQINGNMYGGNDEIIVNARIIVRKSL
ncbi:MAG TPA: LacI family DNA-binding transcriptional regulator [Bacteroidales bacterium]|nr:LacI family DNA-binding transcriptional regulator [Bacteroidales bacterium]